MSTKKYSLILNKSYQPLGVENFKKSLGYLVNDEGYALDADTYETFTFEQWVSKKHPTEKISTIRTEKLWILIPDVIVLKTNSMPRKRKGMTNISKKKVFDRDNHTCGYCGCHLNSKNRTIDHVVPTSKGGPKNDYKNVVACCATCNQKKGDRSLEEMNWTIKHSLYHPETNIFYHVPKDKMVESWKKFVS